MDSVDAELSTRQLQINDLVSDLQKLLASHHHNYQDEQRVLDEEMRSSTSTRAEVSAATTTSSKKGKVLAEDYHSSIVPALLSIAEKVKQQKNCLQKFSSNIQDDLGQMRSNVGKSLDEIVKIVSDTEQLVQEHFEQEEKSVADLKEINNQVVTSQETLKKTVD